MGTLVSIDNEAGTPSPTPQWEKKKCFHGNVHIHSLQNITPGVDTNAVRSPACRYIMSGLDGKMVS